MVNKIITYDLLNNNISSSNFYNELNSTTSMFLKKLKKTLNIELKGYKKFIKSIKIETVRSIEEYGIEIILFAILYRWYLKEIKEIPIDKEVSYEYLQEAFDYFKKSGEFKEEVLRFRWWIKYFKQLTIKNKEKLWNRIMDVVSFVDKVGEEYLLKYIPRLDEFIVNKRKLKGIRKDLDLLLRDKSCYYINMLGADLLNRLYKREFDSANNKYVFLPGCMTERGAKCNAKIKSDGFGCVHCSRKCIVSELTKMCIDNNIKVRILYHESEMNNKKVSRNSKIGVVGVACILNLVSGGFKARRLGYIPQCVFLDYCGCKQHWSNDTIITRINKEQLYKVLNITISKDI